MVNEPFQEQKLRIPSFEIDIGEDTFLLNFPSKRRICKDHVKSEAGVRTALARRQGIVKFDVGLLKAVKVEVQDRNLHHVGVVVVTGESLFFKELPLGRFQQVAITDSARPSRPSKCCYKECGYTKQSGSLRCHRLGHRFAGLASDRQEQRSSQ